MSVDLSAGKVSGDVTHFTKFAVLATEKVVSKATLTDIAGHWAKDNINKLVALGAISGYPDGTFKPDNQITRAEFATVLVKAFKLQQQSGKVFGDTAGHWAKDYVATAAANGVVNGYDATTFGPDDPVTREQIAAMIVRAGVVSFILTFFVMIC
ncbi:S-layer homology domain-containing protein [Pelotomaculum isophthalicicum JI]|uniref:S-layer homology domain-containing protein n=1 Tax=Pelotomaculum isophthalicicum JI TaxID=947010 RepID=A0A9X4H5S9_9FIRM|nr:S-layer homology domain-containing protein [Pelotomaculum isophthalicicum]MDF9407889.1 S-layer homology domain-containing protein [Pelotomaculum isophthalicicum JI]